MRQFLSVSLSLPIVGRQACQLFLLPIAAFLGVLNTSGCYAQDFRSFVDVATQESIAKVYKTVRACNFEGAIAATNEIDDQALVRALNCRIRVAKGQADLHRNGGLNNTNSRQTYLTEMLDLEKHFSAASETEENDFVINYIIATSALLHIQVIDELQAIMWNDQDEWIRIFDKQKFFIEHFGNSALRCRKVDPKHRDAVLLSGFYLIKAGSAKGIDFSVSALTGTNHDHDLLLAALKLCNEEAVLGSEAFIQCLGNVIMAEGKNAFPILKESIRKHTVELDAMQDANAWILSQGAESPEMLLRAMCSFKAKYLCEDMEAQVRKFSQREKPAR